MHYHFPQAVIKRLTAHYTLYPKSPSARGFVTSLPFHPLYKYLWNNTFYPVSSAQFKCRIATMTKPCKIHCFEGIYTIGVYTAGNLLIHSILLCSLNVEESFLFWLRGVNNTASERYVCTVFVWISFINKYVNLRTCQFHIGKIYLSSRIIFHCKW